MSPCSAVVNFRNRYPLVLESLIFQEKLNIQMSYEIPDFLNGLHVFKTGQAKENGGLE